MLITKSYLRPLYSFVLPLAHKVTSWILIHAFWSPKKLTSHFDQAVLISMIKAFMIISFEVFQNYFPREPSLSYVVLQILSFQLLDQ